MQNERKKWTSMPAVSRLEKKEFEARVIERFWNYRMMRTRPRIA
jgi:hypothetical protein